MFKFTSLVVGTATLLIGNALIFVLRFLPPPGVLFWLAPLLLVAGSLWLIWRNWGAWVPLVLLVLTFGTAFFLSGLVWPDPRMPMGNRPYGGAPDSTPRSESLPARPVMEGRRISVGVVPRFRGGQFSRDRFVTAPPGFSVDLFAMNLEKPRFMAFDDRGNLYVSLPRSGKVVALPDRDKDGTADEAITFARDLDLPHGLAWDRGGLIVAEEGGLIRLVDADGDLVSDEMTVLSRDLPTGGGHWTRSIVLNPRGGYFVSAGSSCNACLEKDPRRAAVQRFPPDGGEGSIFARGLRNSVGLAIHPATGELWGSDNGRDMLGDERPPDEINLIIEGGDYGWPFCYGDQVPDPELGRPERCAETLPPEVKLQAHSAPLGITFGFNAHFPEPFRSMLFVAYHGSWNRTVPTGYKVVGIPFRNGRPSGPVSDFITGWLEGTTAWGRPVAPVVGPDGALYLSDDRAGAVYRIVYRGPGST